MHAILRIALAGTLLVVALAAEAHGKLVVSTPANGATLDRAPDALRFQFNEPVESAFTKVALTGPGSQPVATGPIEVDESDPTRVVLALPPLPMGMYHADWTMVGRDGHKIKGTITFSVK